MINITPPNDWPFTKLLISCLAITAVNATLTYLLAIGTAVPVINQLLGFILVTFVPGLLLMRILRIHDTGFVECIAYSAGLSLFLIMVCIAGLDMALPVAGFTRPISSITVTTSIVIVVLLLSLVAWLRDKDYAGPVAVTRVSYMSLPSMLALALILLLTILSTKLITSYNSNLLLLTCILCIAAVYILASFGKFIRPADYPFVIFITAVCLLYQTTLLSPYLVGTDIYAEYNTYNSVVSSGYWDFSIAGTVNSCLSIAILAPVYSYVLNIPGIWVFKAVYPLIFAFVPVILYHVFSQQIGRRKALLSAFFFMIVPTFSLEMISLCRQQVAEFFLALFLLLLIEIQLSQWKKTTLAIIFSFSILLSHYATGFISFAYLGLFIPFVLLLDNRWVRSLWYKLTNQTGGLPDRERLPLRTLWILVAAFFLTGLGWYAVVASGINLEVLKSLWNSQIKLIAQGFGSLSSVSQGTLPNLDPGDALIRTALGLDFLQSSPLGQIFRIFQLATQALIIIGLLRVIFRPKGLGFTIEYLALCITSCMLLAACILIPGFAIMLNTTRMYHLSLLTLAPLCVIGGETAWFFVSLLWQRIKRTGSTINFSKPYGKHSLQIVTLAILAPYFFFTSGLMFEITHQDVTDKVEIPYSIALSSYRLDLSGIFTVKDNAAAQWVATNINRPNWVYIDDHNARILLLNGYQGNMAVFPLANPGPPAAAFIFLSSWNAEKQELTFAVKPGLRKHLHICDIPALRGALDSGNLIYNNGGAQVFSASYPAGTR